MVEQVIRQKEVIASVRENDAAVKVELLKPIPDEPAKAVSIKAQRINKVSLPTAPDIHKPLSASVRHVEKSAVIAKKLQPVKPYSAKETNIVESDQPEPVMVKPELRVIPVIDTVPRQAIIIPVEPPAERYLNVAPQIEDNTLFEQPVRDVTTEFEPLFTEPQELLTIIEPAAEIDDIHQSESQEVVEATTVFSETVEQATTLLAMLPKVVQVSLKEYTKVSKPEEVEAIETKIVIISKVADRLHQLFESNEGESEEAEQIVFWLTEQYVELLNALGVKCDEKTVAAFIELIKSEDYVITAEISQTQEPYDPMRERHGWSDLRGRQTTPGFAKFLRAELVRFAVHHGLAA